MAKCHITTMFYNQNLLILTNTHLLERSLDSIFAGCFEMEVILGYIGEAQWNRVDIFGKAAK